MKIYEVFREPRAPYGIDSDFPSFIKQHTPEGQTVVRCVIDQEGTSIGLVEDALKHIFKCERYQRTCTLESLAGALSISTGRASEILALTQAKGLLELVGNISL